MGDMHDDVTLAESSPLMVSLHDGPLKMYCFSWQQALFQATTFALYKIGYFWRGYYGDMERGSGSNYSEVSETTVI